MKMRFRADITFDVNNHEFNDAMLENNLPYKISDLRPMLGDKLFEMLKETIKHETDDFINVNIVFSDITDNE